MRNVVFLIIAVICLSSCQSTLKKIYGVKSVNTVSERDILAYGTKHNLSNIYLLENSFSDYRDSLKKNIPVKTDDTNYINRLLNDISQPLQLMCFDKEGNLISYMTNCATGGFPNLKWNRINSFDTFPPKPISEIYPEIKLQDIYAHLKMLYDDESDI